VLPVDEEDEGEIPFGEPSDAERELRPDVPEAPKVKTFDDGGDFAGASDLDNNTLSAFVAAVIYANVAVLLVALGPMVWFFEGMTQVGALLLLLGVLAGVRTYQTWRAWDQSREPVDEHAASEAAVVDDSLVDDPDDGPTDDPSDDPDDGPTDDDLPES
jgi:hypothetical protein